MVFSEIMESGMISLNNNNSFLIRKVHSLLGIIPVGIFLLVHLLLNSTVLLGGFANYLGTITWMKSLPLIIVAELIIIAIPILFHGIYGIWIVYVAKNNVLKFNYVRNWTFYLQRITAIITLIFLIIHVYTLRLMQHEPAAVLDTLVNNLNNPVYFILYAIGVLSALFHFSNGLFTFLISWGITIGDKSQTFFYRLSVAVFLVLGSLGMIILTKIAIG